MVKKKRAQKYINKIGQKTGTSKTLKNVISVHTMMDFMEDHQNLNSGTRLLKMRSPSFMVPGSNGPSASGSICGVRKPINKFSR